MQKNPKKFLLLSVVVMIFLNQYLKNHTAINDNIRTAIEIIMALASIALFVFSLKQDKENAKKKLILAGIYVAITLLITFFFLNRM